MDGGGVASRLATVRQRKLPLALGVGSGLEKAAQPADSSFLR